MVGRSDPSTQTEFILLKIEGALKSLGAELTDVVRTRIYVTDITSWKEIGKVHGKFFGQTRPVTSMVEVRKLIMPDLLVEIEAEAVVGVEWDDNPSNSGH